MKGNFSEYKTNISLTTDAVTKDMMEIIQVQISLEFYEVIFSQRKIFLL